MCFLGILYPLNSASDYKVINRLGQDGKFWYYKSPVCVRGNVSFSPIIFDEVQGIVYFALMASYLHFGYKCVKLRVDEKYFPWSVFIIPPTMLFLGLLNSILALFHHIVNEKFIDYDEIIMTASLLIAAAVITIADVATVREVVAAVKKAHNPVTQFTGKRATATETRSRVTVLSSVSSNQPTRRSGVSNQILALQKSVCDFEEKALKASVKILDAGSIGYFMVLLTAHKKWVRMETLKSQVAMKRLKEDLGRIKTSMKGVEGHLNRAMVLGYYLTQIADSSSDLKENESSFVLVETLSNEFDRRRLRGALWRSGLGKILKIEFNNH